MAAVEGEQLWFGEIIDKSLFEESMVEVTLRLRKLGKSFFDLKAAKDEMSPEKDKYVFINIFNGHCTRVGADDRWAKLVIFRWL